MSEKQETGVVARGPHGSVEFARDAQGWAYAADFLAHQAPSKDARRLRRWFQVMANEGRITNPQAFKHERGAIFAFKSSQCRVPCFQKLQAWYLTHGFIKKKDRWLEVEFRRADRIMAEHLERGGS